MSDPDIRIKMAVFPNTYVIETWDQFDRAVEAGWPAEYIKEHLPVMLDYNSVVQQYKIRKGIAINMSIGPADPTPPSPPRKPHTWTVIPLKPTPPTPYQNGYAPVDPHAEFKQKFRDKAAQLCRCDIKDLMSSGHVKGCPEKKK